MRKDTDIQKDVMEQLKWEPVLNAAEIGVTVRNGVVTLSGQVDTYAKKLAAERATLKVSGVKAVAEDILVGVSSDLKKSDTELAEAVLTALKWNTLIKEDKIKIKVEDGIVTLDGEVEWGYQRLAAQNAIANLAGVRKVENLIIVQPETTVTPATVKEKISSAFHRIATLHSKGILVDVIGSTVILKGTVRTFAEKEEAENAAWSAPGVRKVDNRLETEPEEFA